ncbi:MAG: hypothetical protein IJV69_04585 [Kiritimatiellae bacterium]|nr:hypothetical protein [Kiritimatiellia bacterium]
MRFFTHPICTAITMTGIKGRIGNPPPLQGLKPTLLFLPVTLTYGFTQARHLSAATSGSELFETTLAVIFNFAEIATCLSLKLTGNFAETAPCLSLKLSAGSNQTVSTSRKRLRCLGLLLKNHFAASFLALSDLFF